MYTQSRKSLVLVAILCAALALSVSSAGAKGGSLDPSFGSGGVVTTVIGTGAYLSALVAEPDGKLVAAGSSSNGAQDVFTLARYDENGSLDATFGSGGVVTTPIGLTNDAANALVRQPDGKLVVAGQGWDGSRYTFKLARYKANGSLDTSFGTSGAVTTAINENSVAEALVLQPDGKVVAAGYSYDVSAASTAFTLARYNPNGTLDTSFGSGGIVTTPIGSNGAEAFALLLQPDGKLVAGGYSFLGTGHALTLARYSPNGTLDAGFGTGGIAKDQGLGFADALVRMPDGNLMVAATFDNIYELALARFGPNGSLGAVTDVTGIRAGSYSGARLVLQPDGWLVAAVQTASSQAGTQVALARIGEYGGFDPTFGSKGVAESNLGPAPGQVLLGGLVLQPDGKLVAGGQVGTTKPEFALARFIGTPPCVVPKVAHLALRQARRRIRHANCSVGAVTRAYSHRVKKGSVISQKPRAGTHRVHSAPVGLTVSKGRHKRA
jgi:uncharacterized delta-60 repeat protein